MSKTVQVTSQDLAEYFGVTIQTVYDWMKKGAPEPKDFTARGYLHDLAAWKEWVKNKRNEPRPPRAKRPPNFTHGTIYGYRTGCSCKKCRKANREYQAAYRKRKKARAK